MKLCAVVFLAIQLSHIVVYGDNELWFPGDGLPNPRTATGAEACGHANGQPSSICDPNNFLKSSDIAQLERLIDNFSRTTPCFCAGSVCRRVAEHKGPKISIAIINEIMTEEEKQDKPKPANRDLPDQLNDAALFAQYLSDDWNFDECNDGILIFYSAVDHVLFTHTGADVSANLTSPLINQISMANRKHFNRGKYYDGFAGLIEGYKSVLQGTYRPRVGQPETPPNVQYLIQEPQSAAATTVTSSLTSIGASIIMLALALFLHF